jgi:hypothetical protein
VYVHGERDGDISKNITAHMRQWHFDYFDRSKMKINATVSLCHRPA